LLSRGDRHLKGVNLRCFCLKYPEFKTKSACHLAFGLFNPFVVRLSFYFRKKETEMEYKSLGRTGLKVSRVGLGCGNFGGIGSSPALIGKGENKSESFALLDYAWEMGINFFDTADAYAGGQSETFIGQWLKSKGGRVRDQLLLSSKVFNPVGEGPNDWGLSRHHILRQIEASLTRLGVDYLDMYLIHEPDPTTPLAETLRALDDAVHQGKVRYLGASNMPAWLLTKALWLSDKYNLYRFDWVQNGYSLLERGDEPEMFPLCVDQGLGYTPFSPLAGGWLTGKYRADTPFPTGSRMTLLPKPYQKFVSSTLFNRLERLRNYAAELGVDMATLALAWVMVQPVVTAPIIGPRRPEHFAPVERALALELTPEECQTIVDILEGKDEDSHSG
jgi:aryl-alcohol dehydrogenase-like predicted oxidoreductase